MTFAGDYRRAWGELPVRQGRLLLLLAAAVALANVAQPYPDIAPLQHIPTVLLILGAPLLLRRFPLSDAALLSLTAFFLLHTLAGRYTYSNVPYDSWARSLTGHDLSGWLGRRNGFDRFVHLAFGLLFVLPCAELLARGTVLGRRGRLYVAVLIVGAASAAYEIFEWLLTLLVAPAIADDYNGQQGDPWDAQKDMALAIMGSIIAARQLDRGARSD